MRGEMETTTDPNKPQEQNQPPQFRIVICDRLGLAPLEGQAAEITDEAILAKLDELLASAGNGATAVTDLATANAELERIRGEYQPLFAREEEARKRQTEAEIEEILKTYADRFASPEAMAPVRELLISNRESGLAILNGLAPVAATTAAVPPGDQHNPEEETAPTPAEKAAEAEALIATIRKETRGEKTPYAKYEDARNEARRRKPDLFA
jgi:hypothetical protein